MSARSGILVDLDGAVPGRGARVVRAWPALVVLALLTASCGPSTSRVPVPAPALVEQSPSDQLFELSPARVHIRRLGPQALRLLAPQWSRVRESDRKAVQATLLSTLSEARLTPFVRARLQQAAAARPDLAAAALEWLRGPVGYEVKFAEATAWSGEKSSDGAFYASVAEVRDNRTPEIRAERVRRLEVATDALPKALDLTARVGTVVARLVNVTRPGRRPIPLRELEATIAREKERPEVIEAYRPVITAALLVRCRDLDVQQLDGYIEFASTEAGAWYHDTLAAALSGAVVDASMDVEGIFELAAHSDEPVPDTGAVDLDSLLVSLPSGREVRLLTFAQGGSPSQPAIVLRYETTLPLADGAAVGREAVEVWDTIRAQVESEGTHSAVLQATGSVDGWVFPFASSRKYAWSRDETGRWNSADAGRAGGLQKELLWSVPP